MAASNSIASSLTQKLTGRDQNEKIKKEEKFDHLSLPCPVPYEHIDREALMCLKPELFEGMRFDFTKVLNEKLSLSHSMTMGSMEVNQPQRTVKIPTLQCHGFGANFIDPKLMLIGRVVGGKANAVVKCELTENLTLSGNAVLSNDQPHISNGVVNMDYKGRNFRTQFQVCDGTIFRASYIQSVTPHLSLGSEVVWDGQRRNSGIGYAARYNTDTMVATGKIASTGMVALSYIQKVSNKLCLASEFMYSFFSKDVTASVGYDYVLPQCRVRGKIDSNGCSAVFLEEPLNVGLKLVLSAEVNPKKKDYKFGLGFAIGG